MFTRHAKESAIAPVLAETLSAGLCHVDDFDTDQPGTFTRDVLRTGSQGESAEAGADPAMCDRCSP